MIKNKYILIVGLLALSLSLVGCSSSVAKLAVTSDEVVTLDASAKVNPSDYLSEVAEGAEVSYTISDNVMTITVTKDDKTETFEVPVEIEEPNVSIDEDITIDTYVGYDIEDYIHEDKGVSHTTSFDEETGDLSVTFTKGEWSTTLDSKVEVIDSDPVYGKYVSTQFCNSRTVNLGTVTLYKDGACYEETRDSHNVWSLNGKNLTITDCGMSYIDEVNTGTISDDGKTITFINPNVCYEAIGSVPTDMVITFTKIED